MKESPTHSRDPKTTQSRHGMSANANIEAVGSSSPHPEESGPAFEDVVGSTQPEFRLDPFQRTWVVIAGGRQQRPALPERCPFCVGGLEAPESYDVKAFPNRWPVVRPPEAFDLDDEDIREALSLLRSPGDPGEPLYFDDRRKENPAKTRVAPLLLPPTVSGEPSDSTLRAPALGRAEVILYTPRHEGSLGTLSEEELRAVARLWRERMADIASHPYVAYVLIFENRGPEVGVTIEHPHGQIYGLPLVPPRIVRELNVSIARSRAGYEPCVACEVIHTEKAGPRQVWEDRHAVALVPYASAWPLAVQIFSKKHVGSILELSHEELFSLVSLLAHVYRAGDRVFDCPLPTMMAFLQAPTRAVSEDERSAWHLRIEVVSPMRKKGLLRYVAGAEVATHLYQNPVSPEEAAERLRRAMAETVR